MDLKDLNSFIGKLTENVINRLNENQTWQYNNLTIDQEELENAALNAAEMKLYDGTDPMQSFYDDYGYTDDEERYMDGLFSTYLSLVEKYLNDPEIQEKYSEETIEDEHGIADPYTLEEVGEVFGLDMQTMNELMSITRNKFPSLSDQERIDGLYRSLEKINGRDLKQSVYYYIQQNLKTETKKLTGDIIKETIIKPIVERYLHEAEMDFVDNLTDDNEDEIEEATTTTSVGGNYTAPAFGADKEAQRRDFFSGGMRKESVERVHSSIKNLVENSLKKKRLINEASLGRELLTLFSNALNNPELFNEPAWISRYEEIQNSGQKSLQFTNTQITTKLVPQYLAKNPSLNDNEGFKNALLIAKGGKYRGEYAKTPTQELVDMDKQLQQNPSLADDENFMTRYNDLNAKYGNRVALGGKVSKRNAGIERDTVQLVSGIVHRIFNYISNIYKEVGLNFNKDYLWIKGNGYGRKSPSQEWDSLRVDIYEKLGYEDIGGNLKPIPGLNNMEEVNEFLEMLNIGDDEEFAKNVVSRLPTWDISELEADEVRDQAENFKKRTEYAEIKRSEYDKKSGFGDDTGQ